MLGGKKVQGGVKVRRMLGGGGDKLACDGV